MKALCRSMVLVVVILVAVVQVASAGGLLPNFPILLGTTGACNNVSSGGPCTETSTLVQLDSKTGKLIKTIGPVGYTVNGLAWDRTSWKLYASTAIGCGLSGSVCPFHGLITINPLTGAGKPVNPNAPNFNLGAVDAPIHSINVDVFGHMVGWLDKFPAGNPTDSYVRIDQHTGIATEFTDTGINTNQNGLAFGEFNLLWNIDSPKRLGNNPPTQTAYLINPYNGKQFASVPVTPPTVAALGDFKPGTNLYYGLNFQGFDPLGATSIVKIDLDANLGKGTASTLGQTVNFLHTLAFIP